MEVTQKVVRDLFEYKDGILYWKVNKTRGIKRGDIAGSLNDNGYTYIKIDSKRYLRSRLIFLYFNGRFPFNFIDHINNKRDDDRIENLREATRSNNNHNQKLNKNNTSGFKGVTKHSQSGKWIAYLTLNNKYHYFGAFLTKEEAANKIKAERFKYHKEFTNNGESRT